VTPPDAATTDAVRRDGLRKRLTIGPLLGVGVFAIYLADSFADGAIPAFWRQGALTAAVMGLLALAGVHEFIGMFSHAGFPIAGRTMRVVTALLCAAPFGIVASGFEDAVPLWPLTIATIVLVFPLAVLSLRQDRMARGIELQSLSLLGFVLVAWPMYLAQWMAFLHIHAVLFLVLVCKAGDVSAYLFGRRFGRTPLIPHVSSGKTVEGAVASAVTSGVLAVALEPWLLRPGLDLGLIAAIPLGIFLSITNQTGDLVESMLKRRCGVKDSSSLLPGHGGVLDLIDSFLFSIPAFALVVALRLQTAAG
jgi:CDP-diglyceride synthetase